MRLPRVTGGLSAGIFLIRALRNATIRRLIDRRGLVSVDELDDKACHLYDVGRQNIGRALKAFCGGGVTRG